MRLLPQLSSILSMRQVCQRTPVWPRRATSHALPRWPCAALWAAELLLSGCEAPAVNYGSCVATCGADADCRTEMSCNAQGLCVARRDMTCGTSVGSGSAGGSAGAGDTLSVEGGTRGAGTVAGAGSAGEATGAGGAIASGPTGGAGLTGTGRLVTTSTGGVAGAGVVGTVGPIIALKGKLAGALAPDSCEAWPYTAEFEVAGPNPPYTWQAVSAPRGMTFDSTTQRAGGSPTESGDLVLQVTDQSGLATQRSFAVKSREKCWFAYISDETGTVRLHLVDPLLGTRLQRPTSSTTEVSVVDYKFSPDGKYIAYRVEDPNAHRTLWLWKSPEWIVEQSIDFGGSVSHYEWSSNGQVLAVAFEGSAGTELGGLDVSRVSEAQIVDGGIHGLRLLQPVAAPISSGLTWYGNDQHVVFRAPSFVLSFDVPSQADLGESGFVNLYSRDTDLRDPSMVFHPNDAGYFVMDPSQYPTVLDFAPTTSRMPMVHGNVAIAANAPFVAFTLGGELRIAAAATNTHDPTNTLPLFASLGCDTILGWSANHSRIICIDENAGAVRAHTIDLAHSSAASAIVENSQTYVNDTWRDHRHIVADSARWAALSTSTSLYLASLEPSAPRVMLSLEHGGDPDRIGLAFSPAEHILAVTSPSRILFLTTQENGARAVRSGVEVTPRNCRDDRLSAPEWCGTQSELVQPAWSADSQVAAVPFADGTLFALDLRLFPTKRLIDDGFQITAACSSTCKGTGRFQP